MVDWAAGADLGLVDIIKFWTIYRQASQNTRIVAKQLQLILEQMHSEVNLQYNDIHLIGHSLGAQTAGLASGHLSGKIGRISGLDPAKPNFEGKDRVCRLDETDATLVDVVHTDIEKFGTNEKSGDIDFWPNGGLSQPGCFLLGCSHGRSMEYFALSIDGACHYTSTHASQLCDNSLCSECPIMGIKADKSSARGDFCLTTTDTKPYC
ncbi:pancreatic lipase-related protein 2-like [Amphiura filiformis]|uniref:pancreatic lipase-related protein 2-like n=1 Tax=Amphiura filiformis TaxID=82378 RepID=UPI003B21A58E